MRETDKIMAICNQKGDVGKTVTAINSGIRLARGARKPFLADVDAKGFLTASLGYNAPIRWRIHWRQA